MKHPLSGFAASPERGTQEGAPSVRSGLGGPSSAPLAWGRRQFQEL
jgi:hypothetical protein